MAPHIYSTYKVILLHLSCYIVSNTAVFDNAIGLILQLLEKCISPHDWLMLHLVKTLLGGLPLGYIELLGYVGIYHV